MNAKGYQYEKKGHVGTCIYHIYAYLPIGPVVLPRPVISNKDGGQPTEPGRRNPGDVAL